MTADSPVKCDVTLTTVLSEDQRRQFQDPAVIQRLLRDAKTIAVVGLSSNSGKASQIVAAYLQRAGYRIIPVNPRGGEILGERVYPDLAAVPEPIDIVDVFRPAAECLGIAEQAIAIKAKALWIQLRIDAVEAAVRASEAGLDVVLDRCTKVEHQRYINNR